MPEETPQTLYNLYIYTNRECNLACRHCWITAKLRKQVDNPTVSLDEYVRFIEQAIPLGLGYVKISGGEPLLRKDVVLGIARFTAEKRITTRVETNGTLIDEEVARTFSETKTQVSVSLDGSNASVHEGLRSVPGCFDDTVRGLKLLRDHGIPVEVILSLHKKNEEDIDEVIDLITSLCLVKPRLKLNPIIATGRGRMMEKRGQRLNPEELLSFIRHVEQKELTAPFPISISSEPAYHSLGYISRGRVQGGRCGFKSLLGILADGAVSYCGMGYEHSEFTFGDVKSIDLEDVWRRHPVLQEVRDQVPTKLQGICGNCIFKATCQGSCRSFAYDVYGSLTAPSPGCQALYDMGLFPQSRMLDPESSAAYTH